MQAHHVSGITECGFTYTPPYTLSLRQPTLRMSYLPASLRGLPTTHSDHRLNHPPPRKAADSLACLASRAPARTLFRRYGNINPLSIDYACRPRLRSRLTQGGLTWPWNPWSFGGRVSHPSFATHACILTRVASTAGLHRRFTGHTTLSYHSVRLNHEGLSIIRNLQLRWCA